jgi:Ca-activated chloride channel homolog
MRATVRVFSFVIGVALLCPLPSWSLGYVYTGVGGDGRELLELTSVTVDVDIKDRIAVTRADQVFTNLSDRQLEGIYEFELPPGAIITDLVLWIGEKRVQGLIMEKEEARQVYDDIVGRNIDPALVEQVSEERFRLSIFPFPAKGSRRVELEYTQILEARGGATVYRFPLAAETEQPILMERFLLRARVKGQHPFALAVDDVFAQATDIQRQDDTSADVFFADEQVTAERDFELTLRDTDDEHLPTLLSFSPTDDDGMGYYALWLPPLSELSESDPLPRSITFIVDISSSMRGSKLDAVKGALSGAIEDLHSGDLFNVVVFANRAMALAPEPMEATAQTKESAMAFLRQQGALGATNFEAALQAGLGQTFPDDRLNHVIFLTDGHPTVGEEDLVALDGMVEQLAGGAIRLFTIGVGDDVNRGFLRTLADDNRGTSRMLSEAGGIESELRTLFDEFTRPIFLPTDLVFHGAQVYDIYPQGMDLLASGQELFQVGRYGGGGDFTLKLSGRVQDRALALDYPLRFVEKGETELPLLPRLWAHQKVQALEAEITRFGPQEEVLDDILDLGLTYRLVTRRTSLFAPDESVEINPQPRDGSGAATAIEESLITATWLGREFRLQDGVWMDLEYQPGMTLEEYDPTADHPAVLADFAHLDQEMIVAIHGVAYKVSRGMLPVGPVLQQSAPNPFNGSTVIRFYVPAALANQPAELTVYNLVGQQVRRLVEEPLTAGAYEVLWDGRDEAGQELASGVYPLRLRVGDAVQVGRMLMVR